MATRLAIKDIRIDGKTQQRELDETVVKEYMEAIKAGAEFPAMSVVTDGKDNWLWDGFHRLFAYRKLGKDYAEFEISKGTRRDAVWKSYNANLKHGFRRQPGTSKEIVRKILADAEWSKISLSEIARHVGVSTSFVSREKEDMGKSATERDAKVTVTRKGRKYQQKSQDSQHQEPEIPLDAKGKPIPKHLQAVFGRAGEIKQHITYMNQMVRDIKEAQGKNDILWVNCKLDRLRSDVGNLRSSLKFAIPFAVCPYCGGDINNEDCGACNGHGFVNELQWIACPDEMKE